MPFPHLNFCCLSFNTATNGVQTDPTDVDPFSYVYTPNGASATLRVQFKSDKWDDYQLDFTAGTFSREEFDKNKKKDSDTGTFALPAAP